MSRTFVIAWLVVFVAWMAGAFLLHGVVLQGDYAQLPNLFRPEAESQEYFPLMLLAHLIMAAAFVWIYARGAENRPWLGQGLRFGLVVALLTTVPTCLIYYVVQPLPGGMVIRLILLESVLLLALGALVAWLYRNSARA